MDPAALGIPADATVFRSSGPLREGWSVSMVGVRVLNPPEPPYPWPYVRLRSGSGPAMVAQIWCRTFAKPGFEYSVTWHPELGRRYHVESDDPNFGSLLKEAQKVIRREQRGRPRQRPTVEQYIADRERIQKAAGGREPSRPRMAEEYGVAPDTVRKWLQRPDWSGIAPDK